MSEADTPSPDQIKADVQTLKAWTYSCPHLPNIDDEDWLETFLRNCKYRLEKTQRKLESYYKLRDKHPGMLKNRDPSAPELLQARRAITSAISDRLTADGHLLVYHKHDPDSSLLDAGPYFKRMFMIHDVILLDRLAPTGVDIVLDCENFRYQHFLRLMTRFRSMVSIFLSCYTEKLKAVHLVNPSKIVMTMIDVALKLTPKKISQRVQVHPVKKGEACLYIDADVLSSDLGGRGLSLAQLDEKTQQLLEKHRNWFQEQDRLCSELSKKHQKEEEEKRSFRKLELD